MKARSLIVFILLAVGGGAPANMYVATRDIPNYCDQLYLQDTEEQKTELHAIRKDFVDRYFRFAKSNGIITAPPGADPVRALESLPFATLVEHLEKKKKALALQASAQWADVVKGIEWRKDNFYPKIEIGNGEGQLNCGNLDKRAKALKDSVQFKSDVSAIVEVLQEIKRQRKSYRYMGTTLRLEKLGEFLTLADEKLTAATEAHDSRLRVLEQLYKDRPFVTKSKLSPDWKPDTARYEAWKSKVAEAEADAKKTEAKVAAAVEKYKSEADAFDQKFFKNTAPEEREKMLREAREADPSLQHLGVLEPYMSHCASLAQIKDMDSAVKTVKDYEDNYKRLQNLTSFGQVMKACNEACRALHVSSHKAVDIGLAFFAGLERVEGPQGKPMMEREEFALPIQNAILLEKAQGDRNTCFGKSYGNVIDPSNAYFIKKAFNRKFEKVLCYDNIYEKHSELIGRNGCLAEEQRFLSLIDTNGTTVHNGTVEQAPAPSEAGIGLGRIGRQPRLGH